jgi:hypothetical protein
MWSINYWCKLSKRNKSPWSGYSIKRENPSESNWTPAGKLRCSIELSFPSSSFSSLFQLRKDICVTFFFFSIFLVTSYSRRETS